MCINLLLQAIEDAEICIMFLNTLKPWIHRLHKSHDTDDIIRVFPPTATCSTTDMEELQVIHCILLMPIAFSNEYTICMWV